MNGSRRRKQAAEGAQLCVVGVDLWTWERGLRLSQTVGGGGRGVSVSVRTDWKKQFIAVFGGYIPNVCIIFENGGLGGLPKMSYVEPHQATYFLKVV